MMRRVLTTLYVIAAACLCLALLGASPGLDKGRKGEINLTYSPDAGAPDRYWPDPGLKDAFTRYWATRFAGDWKAARKLEAPYFQEMTEPRRYGVYMEGSVKNKLIEMKLGPIAWETDHLYKIACVTKLKLENGKEQVVHLQDLWVRAGGRWYHVIRDNFFFRGV